MVRKMANAGADLESICEKDKIVKGTVRITMAKFYKIAEYLMCALSPGWNMPEGSPMDYDTLAPEVVNTTYKAKQPAY